MIVNIKTHPTVDILPTNLFHFIFHIVQPSRDEFLSTLLENLMHRVFQLVDPFHLQREKLTKNVLNGIAQKWEQHLVIAQNHILITLYFIILKEDNFEGIYFANKFGRN